VDRISSVLLKASATVIVARSHDVRSRIRDFNRVHVSENFDAITHLVWSSGPK
jgi:hypothetical protein